MNEEHSEISDDLDALVVLVEIYPENKIRLILLSDLKSVIFLKIVS